jgi:hypothetical protein
LSQFGWVDGPLWLLSVVTLTGVVAAAVWAARRTPLATAP